MAIDIDFEWSIDGKGYRLDSGRIIGNGGPKRRYRLKEFPTLYLIFAKTPQTPEGLLGFVSRFGRLSRDKIKEPDKQIDEDNILVGDDVRKVLPHVEMISMVLGLKGHTGKWEGGPFEYDMPRSRNLPRGLRVSGGIPLLGKLTASLAPDPATGVFKLKLTPPTLLDAIWLQLSQAITSNANLRQCRHCDGWFEAGAASGRRADAKFCSDVCRVEFNSRKRSQS
jgi:hypothetical protein